MGAGGGGGRGGGTRGDWGGTRGEFEFGEHRFPNEHVVLAMIACKN